MGTSKSAALKVPFLILLFLPLCVTRTIMITRIMIASARAAIMPITTPMTIFEVFESAV